MTLPRSATRSGVRVTALQTVGTQPLFAKAKAFGGGSGEVFVAGGANGLVSTRLVQELLKSGEKVAAGAPCVPDAAAAQAVVDFAVRFELLGKAEAGRLRLVELDFSDSNALAAALPRRASTVVAVLGDTSGARNESRAALALLEAAEAVGAGRFVLVAPVGGSRGGGTVFSLFGGGGGTSSAQVEQAVANSSLATAIVRTGRIEADVPSGGRVELAPQGALPAGATISPTQVAHVVAQVLAQASGSVLLEAWAGDEAADGAADGRGDIAARVAEVLPAAAIEEEEAEEEEEPEAAPPPAAAPLGGLFGRAKAAAKGAADEAQELADDAPQPAKRMGGLFGRAKAAAKDTAEDVKEAVDKKPRKPVFGVLSRAMAAANDDEEEPAPKKGFFGGFGTQRLLTEPKEEPATASANPLATLFGGKTAKAEEAMQTRGGRARPAARGARGTQPVSAKTKARAAPAPPARRGSRGVPADDAPKPKRGGLLQVLGIAQQTVYNDE
ncbi:hypothetical protein WJX81_005190 [Elliptochloris bilobata]|uniref:NAD(P)-binding domain-containing protein n=1 Tax=Elliptochloris bilobata TaxID=381761 RepID=A0AAW1Q9M3_9CHLO